MSIHSALLDLYKALGYPNDEVGLCHGFAVRWLEAFLLGKDEEERFERRINLIASMPTEDLVEKLEQIKTKVIAGAHLTALECELREYDIANFIESLALYQQPDLGSFLINRFFLAQDKIEVISFLASSLAIKERGGLNVLCSAVFLLDEDEITAYLGRLGELFDKFTHLSKEPIGCLLGSEDHTLALAYQPGQGWTYRNINSKIIKASKPVENYSIALAIKKGFFQNNSPYLAFNTQVILTGFDPRLQALEKELKSFIKTHLITKEEGFCQTSPMNLVYMTALYNQPETATALIDAGADLNQTYAGMTPAYIASQNGYTAIIKVLVQAGADLNQAHEGATPLYIAAQNGHVAIVKRLVQAGVDLNQAYNGATPLYMAAKHGHVAILKILVQAGADLNQTCYGATPAYIASENGHHRVVKILLAAHANFSIPRQNTVARLKTFALTKGNDVSQRMELFLKNKPDTPDVSLTPYQIANIMGHRKIIELIRQYNSRGKLIGQSTTQAMPSFFPKKLEGTAQRKDSSNNSLKFMGCTGDTGKFGTFLQRTPLSSSSNHCIMISLKD